MKQIENKRHEKSAQEWSEKKDFTKTGRILRYIRKKT